MVGLGAILAGLRKLAGCVLLVSVLLTAFAFLATVPARAQNLTYGELKLGVLDHDTHLLEGKEGGVDINPELIGPSPIPDYWAAAVPAYLRWMVQPRPTIGAELNTAGFTHQFWFGATWSWYLARNLLKPDDGITFGIFFGPSWNDGDKVATRPNRKSLGSNILFREAFELGYQINPVWNLSIYLDHTSNAGFARYNQSINDLGARIGFRF